MVRVLPDSSEWLNLRLEWFRDEKVSPAVYRLPVFQT